MQCIFGFIVIIHLSDPLEIRRTDQHLTFVIRCAMAYSVKGFAAEIDSSDER